MSDYSIDLVPKSPDTLGFKEVTIRNIKLGPIWEMRRVPEVRCPGCYLPLDHNWDCDWFTCWLCQTKLTNETIQSRGRIRRWWDRVQGLVT